MEEEEELEDAGSGLSCVRIHGPANQRLAHAKTMLGLAARALSLSLTSSASTLAASGAARVCVRARVVGHPQWENAQAARCNVR